MFYSAHIREAAGGETERQSVAAHLTQVADGCAMRLETIGLPKLGYLTGLLHDAGKFTQKFNDYIEKAAAGEAVVRGSVNHTFTGVKLVLSLFHSDACRGYDDITAELIGYAIAAHHGMIDGYDEYRVSGFLHRLNGDAKEISYDEAVTAFYAEMADKAALTQRFQEAVQEVTAFFGILRQAGFKNREGDFAAGMLARLLLSALVDADRADTAAFMTASASLPIDTPPWDTVCDFYENKIAHFTADSPINAARQRISAQCRAFVDKSAALCRLTVPTGGGKTLASLRYALHKARQEKKRHIFFVIPLLSVIEQNAAVLREYIGNDGLILEHHSNVVQDTDGDTDRYKLLTESWNAPVVITTLVQLLNTLFDGSNGCARRMNALCDSVIVIDEIQSLPHKLTSLFNTAIRFLTDCCKATVVLCSATQPSLEEVPHPLFLGEIPDMVTYDNTLWQPFSRTTIVNLCRTEGYSFEDAAMLCRRITESCRSLLIVGNTKSQVRALYQALLCANTGCRLFHLSTAMCMKHRQAVMKEIRTALAAGERVICVSSQLIEAGVDISFEAVIRAQAGLDNIAQAAGRCNRNGEFLQACSVYVINFKEENLRSLPDIAYARNACRHFFYRFEQQPNGFSGNVLSDKSIHAYYHLLFTSPDVSKSFDFPCPQLHSSLFEMLSRNEPFLPKAPPFYLNQAFKTAGQEFEVFGEKGVDVIVPYDDEAKDIIAGLYSERAVHDLAYLAMLLQRAKPYTISLFDYQKRVLEQAHGLHSETDKPFLTLLPAFYDCHCYGLDLQGIPTNPTDFIQ